MSSDATLTEHFVVPSAAVPFLVAAAVGVVGGGLVAAVTDPLGWEHGSWASAFLVLVVGVGQAVLGAGQVHLGARPDRRTVVAQMVSYDLASALVILGTLVTSPALVAVASALFLVSLVLFARVALVEGETGPIRKLYLAVLVLLIVSTPVGIVLSVVSS